MLTGGLKKFFFSMRIRKLQAVFILTLLLVPTQTNATTVVLLVTRNGMIVSSDSKTVSRRSDFSAAGHIEQSKFAIIHNRIVISAIGVSDYRDAIHHYNFLAWMQDLELRLPADISVDDIAEVIERESSAIFSEFDIGSSLRKGTIKRKFPAWPGEIFSQFVIAGYEKGAPRVYKVQFDIDWDTQSFIGPVKVLLYPDPADADNYQIFRFGTQEAIADFLDRKSYAYQEAKGLCPKAVTDIAGGVYPSFDENVCLSRALVRVEEKTNPDEVGGTVRTVRILPSGAEEVAGARTILSRRRQSANK
jgi:hypothetical protein